MRIIGWIAAAALVAGTTACGGSDEAVVAEPTTAAPAKAERAVKTGTNHAPVIRSVIGFGVAAVGLIIAILL